MLTIKGIGFIDNTEPHEEDTLHVPFNHTIVLADKAGNEYQLIVTKDVQEAVKLLMSEIEHNERFA